MTPVLFLVEFFLFCLLSLEKLTQMRTLLEEINLIMEEINLINFSKSRKVLLAREAIKIVITNDCGDDIDIANIKPWKY